VVQTAIDCLAEPVEGRGPVAPHGRNASQIVNGPQRIPVPSARVASSIAGSKLSSSIC
jgi:hypothetical protein